MDQDAGCDGAVYGGLVAGIYNRQVTTIMHIKCKDFGSLEVFDT
jgi:hypothetical protein